MGTNWRNALVPLLLAGQPLAIDALTPDASTRRNASRCSLSRGGFGASGERLSDVGLPSGQLDAHDGARGAQARHEAAMRESQPASCMRSTVRVRVVRSISRESASDLMESAPRAPTAASSGKGDPSCRAK